MSVFDNKAGISVATGFKLQAKAPLDARAVVDTIEERNELVTYNGAYEGMKVYVKSDKKTYTLKGETNSDWKEESSESRSSQITALTKKLLSINWSDKKQTIDVSGISSDETKQLINIMPVTNDLPEYLDCDITCVEQKENQLVFSCKKLPTSDLSVYITIQDVNYIESD